MTEQKDPYKFFYKKLNLDLSTLTQYLQSKYDELELELSKNDGTRRNTFDYTQSASTMLWNKYNVFQFYDDQIRMLIDAVKEIALEACEYYGIDFKKEMYMAQSWFNITNKNSSQLNWHEHSLNPLTDFHGYFCVNAEPSYTFYRINEEVVAVENVNNVALLGATGREHAVGEWLEDSKRITIAYDIIPMRNIVSDWEQHWIPLLA